jgi:hypothetical protein
LQKSQVELDSDRRQVIEFVQKQNEKKQSCEDREKELNKEKLRLDDEIRQNEMTIQSMRSEIDKNSDVLVALQAYREFVLKLSQDDEKEREKFQKDKAKMRLKLQQEWIEWAQVNSYMDDIIFDEGDILGEDYKLLQIALAKQPQDPTKRMMDLSLNRSLQQGS